MLTRDMLQMLRTLKVETRKKADALDELADFADSCVEPDSSYVAAFENAIDAVRDTAGDMDNFADDVARLLEDYEEMLLHSAGKVNTLVGTFIYPDDFKNNCQSKETYL